MRNKIATEVNLASQTHHVPHIVFPHSEPVSKHMNVKHAPIGAAALAPINASGCLQISPVAHAMAIVV